MVTLFMVISFIVRVHTHHDSLLWTQVKKDLAGFHRRLPPDLRQRRVFFKKSAKGCVQGNQRAFCAF
jgi:hypothetical protein